MSGGRCYRRKMMGRGAEGGFGAEEKPCPASRASSNAAASTASRVEGVDLYAQARKALTEHSPFEEPDELARVSTLPVALATSLLKSSDSRRKHKKLLRAGESVKKVPSAQPQPEVWSFWNEVEGYFRPIVEADIDMLGSKCQIVGFSSDSSFTIPVLPSMLKQEVSALELDVSSHEEGKSEEEYELGKSIAWILGSKQRSFVTSERQTKKRKLASFDSDHRNLLLLPNAVPDNSRVCDFCCSEDDSDADNRLLSCDSCKVSVHMKCYGVKSSPEATWLCSWCKLTESNPNSEKACALCPKKDGALKTVGTDVNGSEDASKFAHLFCSLWVPEVFIDDIKMMEPIINAELVSETRKRAVCSVCKMKGGACIRCCHGACQTSFHAICARGAKLRMEIWGKGTSDEVELLVFCAKHSTPRDTCVENLSAASNNKVLKIKTACKDGEKSLGSEDVTSRDNSDSSGISKSEQSGEMNNGSSDFNDLLAILKKLSDRGKVRVPEIALEMGIPLDLLEPVIRGQTLSISSELKAKVIKWFQDYVHLGGPTKHAISANCVDVGSVLVKSLPSRRRTKSDGRVLKDHKVVSPSGDGFIDEDFNVKDVNISPVYESDYTNKVREILLKMEDGASICSEVNSLASRSQQCNGSANIGEAPEYEGAALGAKTEALPGSQIHPFIQKKLRKIDAILSCQDEAASPMEIDLSMKNCSNHSVCSVNDGNIDQLARSLSADVIKSIPEDEVEGEILYFQNKLVDTVVAIKQRCEKLMQCIISLIPKELDSLRKQRWDIVAVNKYIRQMKEAKKRGRKEKRHREFKEVLAAASAATETSTRVASLRKDKVDGVTPIQETGDRISQAKDAHVKSSTPKISSEKHSDVPEDLCDICGRPETMLNKIFICKGCKVAVHLDCYQRPRSPINSWCCEACTESSVGQCCLCASKTGAFRKTTSGQWVHNVCAEWILQSTFLRGQENAVEGVEAALLDNKLVDCSLCNQKAGACIKCNHGDCLLSFHPCCAKKAGLLMITRDINGKMHRNAYCEKHGAEKKQKADVRQYNAEELKSIKQIRVELEKVRLLCERIIRREKLKRDLVLSSHEVLSSRRDCAALTSLVDLGVSSESATTSLRSDDVTIDSSLSSKRGSRVSSKSDHPNASARKGTGKMALTSGKSVPRKSTTSQSAQRSKLRKQPEIFHKEVVMTSDQASIQNKRLPKGFVYVPVDSLSKSKSSDSLEPRRHDG